MTVLRTRESVVPAPRVGDQIAQEPRPEAPQRRTRPPSQYWDHREAQWVTRSPI